MEKLIPNTLIYDRFLLKEEVSADTQTGKATWALTDQQNGQNFIVIFHTDGHTEWFNDNRSPESAAPASKPAADPLPQKTIQQETTKSPAGNVFAFLGVMLILGIFAVVYLYKDDLSKYIENFKTSEPGSMHVVDNVDADSTALYIEKQVSAEKYSVKISLREAADLLNSLSSIQRDKHEAIFSNAQKAFAAIRNDIGQTDFRDSLFIVFSSKGAQSFLAHQQNGDSISKSYAINWYETAYALKPSKDLRERLNRMNNITHVEKKQRPVKSQKASSLFEADPELKNN